MGETLQLYLLGDFRIEVGDRLIPVTAWSRRAAADVVKFLALERSHAVHPEVLIDALWPDLTQDAATNKFHKAVHAARRALEPSLPPHGRSSYIRVSDSVISLDHACIDVDRFEQLAQAAIRTGARSELERALAAYQGILLPGDRYEDWTRLRRDELTSLHRRLTLALVQVLEGQGAVAPAIDHLHGLLREDRTDELVHRRIMQLQARSGHDDEALRQYGLLRKVLAVELGTTPDSDTEMLRAAIESGRENAVSNLPDRAALRRGAEGNASLGRTLAATGRYDEALQRLARAADMYTALGDREGHARALAAIGHIHFARSTPSEGITLLAAVDQEPLPPAARAALLASLSGLYWLQCEYARQLQIAELAEMLAEEGEDEAVRVEAAVWRGVALVALESVVNGIAVLEKAADDAERVGEARSAGRALNTIAAALHERGDYERERIYVERALVYAARSGDPTRLTFMLYRSGWNAYNLGRWNDAQLNLERAAAVSEPFPAMWSRPYALHGLAWLYLCRGSYMEAREWAERALSALEAGGDRRAAWSLQGLLGHLELREGRPVRAAEQLGSALQGPGLTDADSALLLSALVLAELGKGETDRARQDLGCAMDHAERSGSEPALFEVLMARAIVLRLEEDIDGAEYAAESARQIARSLRQPYFEARAVWESALLGEARGDANLAALHRSRANAMFDALGVLPHARGSDLHVSGDRQASRPYRNSPLTGTSRNGWPGLSTVPR